MVTSKADYSVWYYTANAVREYSYSERTLLAMGRIAGAWDPAAGAPVGAGHVHHARGGRRRTRGARGDLGMAHDVGRSSTVTVVEAIQDC